MKKNIINIGLLLRLLYYSHSHSMEKEQEYTTKTKKRKAKELISLRHSTKVLKPSGNTELDHIFDSPVKFDPRENILISAMKLDDPEYLMIMLKYEYTSVHAQTPDGAILLKWAQQNHYNDIAQLLIARYNSLENELEELKNIFINKQLLYSDDPFLNDLVPPDNLIQAMKLGNSENVMILLKYGCPSVNSQTYVGKILHKWAQKNNYNNIINLLIARRLNLYQMNQSFDSASSTYRHTIYYFKQFSNLSINWENAFLNLLNNVLDVEEKENILAMLLHRLPYLNSDVTIIKALELWAQEGTREDMIYLLFSFILDIDSPIMKVALCAAYHKGYKLVEKNILERHGILIASNDNKELDALVISFLEAE